MTALFFYWPELVGKHWLHQDVLALRLVDGPGVGWCERVLHDVAFSFFWMRDGKLSHRQENIL